LRKAASAPATDFPAAGARSAAAAEPAPARASRRRATRLATDPARLRAAAARLDRATMFGKRVTAVARSLLCLALGGLAAAHVPHDVVHGVAVSPAFAQDGLLLAWCQLLDRNLLARSTDGGRSWLLLGHVLLAESPHGIVFSPDFAQDATVYIATSRRVWRSVDGGLHWSPSSAGLDSDEVHDLAISPTFAADGLLLAASADGAWISHDRGESWTPSGAGLTELDLGAVACGLPPSSGAPAVLYAGNKRVHRSLDGGASWQPLVSFAKPLARLVAPAEPALPKLLLGCFGRNGGGLVSSLDGGESFAPLNTGLTDLNVNDVALAVDGRLFCATEKSAFRAASLGAAWTPCTNGFDELSSQTSSHHYTVAVSPALPQDGRVWIAAWEGLYDSHDAGDDWFEDEVYNHLGNTRVSFSPGWPADRSIVLGNFGDGALFGEFPSAPTSGLGGATSLRVGREPQLSSAAGALPSPGAPQGWSPKWRASGKGISQLCIDTHALSPGFAQDDTLFTGGTGLWRSLDRGHSWTTLKLPGFLAYDVAVTPQFASDRKLFLGSCGTGLFLSQDAGDTWTALRGGAPPDLETTRLAISPQWAQDHTLFSGSREQGVWRSTDGGQSWSELATLPAGTSRVVALSPDFGSDGLVVVGLREQGLWLSHDGGASFARVSAGLPTPGWPEGDALTVESVVFSPAFAHDRTAFLSTLEHGAFRSIDGGESWTAIGHGLSAAATRELAISPDFAQDRRLLLATWDWVWSSEDAGDSWQRLPGLLRTDDGYHGVHHDGAWNIVKSQQVFGAGWHKSWLVGDVTWIEFFGRRASFFALPQPGGATALIELDGVQVAAVPLAAPVLQASEEVWSQEFPQNGWHLLRVLHGGAAGTVLASDGFEFRF
jgi:hypothetical protein